MKRGIIASLCFPFLYYAKDLNSSSDNIPNDFELKYVAIVSRHGLRTPIKTPSSYHGEWECHQQAFTVTYLDHPQIQRGKNIPSNHLYAQNYINDHSPLPGNCFNGQLTTKGRLQMENVGKELRNRYIKDEESPKPTQYLPKFLNLTDIFVRSTDSKRTLETAQCLMNSIYPPENRDHGLKGVITIHTKDKSSENMYARSGCPALPVLKKAVYESEQYKKHKEKYTSLKEYFKKHARAGSWVGMLNTYDCMVGNKMPLPDFFTPEIHEKLKEAAGAEGIFSFYTKEICSLSIGRFVGDIMQGIDNYLNNPSKTPKFSLYSGHDNTISPLLSGFEIRGKYHPSMGSILIFEIWEDTSTNNHYVRIIFNNEVKRLTGCGDFCSLEYFKKKANELIPYNYEEQCKTY